MTMQSGNTSSEKPETSQTDQGESQTPNVPEKGKDVTEQATTVTLDVLHSDFSEFRKLFNREMAARRKEIEALSKPATTTTATDGSSDQNKVALTEAQAKLETALSEAKNLRLQMEVERAALSAGFSHPDDVWRLVDRSAFVIGDDGKVQGITEQVEEIKKRYPAMLAQTGPRKPQTDGEKTTETERRDKDLDNIKKRYGIR